MNDKKKFYIDQIKLVEKEIGNVDKDISELAGKKLTLTEKLQDLNIELDKLNNADIKVSDHAVLRFIERFGNLLNERFEDLDIDALREFILPEELKESIAELGNCTYPVNNKFKLVIRNGVVVTVK